MGHRDKFLIHWAEGRGVNLGKAVNKVGSWGEFCSRLSKPTKTAEKRRVFDKMPKDQQDELKAIDGWIMGAQVAAGRRTKENIKPRDLLSLDYDYATPRFLDGIELGLTPLSQFEFVVFSTRRHTSEKPRVRLYAPLARPVTRDEYVPLSRLLAMKMERKAPMTMVDKVSFRQAQMMFKPTISIDGDWFYHRNDGDLLDPDAIFAEFPNWRDYSTLPLCADEEELRKSADKAENPTEKKGPVGDFCRAYDVPAAIVKFLPDCYAPVDEYSTKPRYTYLKGTSTSGAVVEDDGLFLYSHHGSDPTADRLVNAFDLVRIHLFGELDEDEDKDTPPTKFPSFKRMLEFIADDPEYRQSQAESRYDIAAMFDDVDEEERDASEEPYDPTTQPFDEPLRHVNGFAHDIEELIGIPASDLSDRGAGSPAGRPKPVKPQAPKDWFPGDLKLDQNGQVMSTMPNAAIIIHNDARMFGAVAFNDFSKRIVLRRRIKSRLDIAPALPVYDRANGDRWQDTNDITIRMILEAPNGEGKAGYGMMMTDRNVAGAIVSASQRNKFHPVREFLDAPGWDGRARIDTLLIRYLGCPDTAYHREVIRLKMIASVARVMEPGCKFDYAIILQGVTGIRKSSFIKALYGEDWFGELDCRLDDKQQIAETIAGKWCLELPELGGFHKSDHNAAKAFMRRQYDDVRMAYDRRVSEFPRQCVFWGTTNDFKYLKDPTGNRSYWPVPVLVEMIDTDAVMAERAQLWAEAMVAYRAAREAKPAGELPMLLSRAALSEATIKQEAARTQELHEMWAERIAEWADRPLTLRELRIEMGVASADERFSDGTATTDFLVQRVAFRRETAVEMALKKDRGIADYQTAQTIERALPLLDDWYQMPDRTFGQTGGARVRVMGLQARWWVRRDATREELKTGYRLVRSPSGGETPAGDDEDLI